MKRNFHLNFVLSLALTIIPVGLVFGSIEPLESTSHDPAYQAIEGQIVAKGALIWDQ